MTFISVQDEITMNFIGADDDIMPAAEGNKFFELLPAVYPTHGIMRVAQ